MTIPVTFTIPPKTYRGELSRVSGTAQSWSFHLMSGGYYFGTLSYITEQPGYPIPTGWRFNSPSYPELDSQADYFGLCVEMWVDCHYLM